MKSIFAGIIAVILSIFGGHQAVSHSASTAAAAAASTISTQPQQASTTSFTADIATTQRNSSPAPISPTPDLSQYVTKSELDTRLSGLSAFSTSLQQLIAAYRPQASTPAVYSFSGSSAPLSVEAFAPSQRIDNLANVTISNATVHGVSGLAAADIPSLSYLPLSGGSLTFASSSLLSVYSGAYFGASATSSFDSAGALSLATPFLVSSGGTGGTSTTTARSNLGLAYALSADITNNINIATWGDSLTAGSGGGGTTYQTALAALSGYTIQNGGVGGDTSTQIKTRMLAATDKSSWPTIRCRRGVGRN